MSKYKELCQEHQRAMVLFCPECLQYKCAKCPETHSNKIIHAEKLEKYMEAVAYKESPMSSEKLALLKKSLIISYNDAKDALQLAYSDAMGFVNRYSNRYEIPNDMGLNPKAIDLLKMESTTYYQNIGINSSESLTSFVQLAVKELDDWRKTAHNINALIGQWECPAKTAHKFDSANNTVTYYSSQNKAIKEIKLTTAFNKYADSIACNNRVFILGGIKPITATVLEIEPALSIAIPRAPMSIPKCGHGLCAFNRCIYSIGGWDGSKALSQCEKYSIIEDKWSNMPQLINARSDCGVFIYNNSCIYAFAGHDDQTCFNSFERMAINEYSHWESIQIINPFTIRRCAQAIQISTTEVLIFGSDIREEASIESYLLTFNSNGAINCKRWESLSEKGEFFNSSSPIFTGHEVYAIDNARKVHIYSKARGNWKQMDWKL